MIVMLFINLSMLLFTPNATFNCINTYLHQSNLVRTLALKAKTLFVQSFSVARLSHSDLSNIQCLSITLRI